MKGFVLNNILLLSRNENGVKTSTQAAPAGQRQVSTAL